MTINFNAVPFHPLPNEKLSDYKLFLFYVSIPSAERTLKEVHKFYCQEYPTEKITFSKLRDLCAMFNWEKRAKDIDKWLLCSVASKNFDARTKLMDELLIFRDNFKQTLKDHFEWQLLINKIGLKFTQQLHDDDPTIFNRNQTGFDSLYEEKAKMLERLTKTMQASNTINKSNFDVWAGVLGLQDIIEKQNATFQLEVKNQQ